jgi:hypothetical protein
MRKLPIAIVAFLALGSTAYAIGGGPVRPLVGGPAVYYGDTQSEFGGPTAGSSNSGYNALAAPYQAPHPARRHWGQPKSWDRSTGY